LVNFYKLHAKKVISPLFQKWEHITSLYPAKVGYRVAKRRWGSCSHINNISINYMLLQFSIDAIEYVVLHELCHIQEKNHSKKFWNLVSLYMPNYKQKEQILKNKMF
jgi:predicted metal-dependent hydrolase